MAQKCVHKGCGKTFTDPEEDCIFHPGPPIFHEGQKGVRAPLSQWTYPPNDWLTLSYRLEMLQAPLPNLRGIPIHPTMHNWQTLDC